ncbi:MAG: FAD-dependent oxidoreductase, partial [Turicibacter sp.]
MKKDIAIMGGSLGGVMAAIGCAAQGRSVYLCEETDWIGGQLTSQAVPPDEHRWIEQFGCTKTYREFRNKVRAYYRNHEQATDEMKNKDVFCPGNSWVSRIAHEPKVALGILTEMMKPYKDLIQIDYFTVATTSIVEDDVIKSVTVSNIKTGETKEIEAHYYLDATDCGDLLPIVKAEYKTGAESKSETNELHAPEIGDPTDLQPITWVFAAELNPDGDYKIPKPDMYDYFKELIVPYSDCKLLSWFVPDALTQDKSEFSFYDNELVGNKLGLWSYRRVIDSKNYKDGRKEVSLINWPENDFHLGNIYDDQEAEKNKELAKQQTMCVVYWLQNDAPRQDGKKGYPVKLRP